MSEYKPTLLAAAINEILDREYHFEFVRDGDTHWYSASIREFEGCFAEGESIQEAEASLRKAARSWLENMMDQGMPIPEPIQEDDDFSGRFY